MSKSKRKNKQLPKLILLDRVIYGTLMVLCALLPLVLLLLLYIVQIVIVSPQAIIYNEKGAYSLLLLLPLLIPSIAAICYLEDRNVNRLPIFGPKPPKDYLESYKKKRRRKGVIITFLICVFVWLLLCIPAVGAIYARYELTETEIVEYGMFNAEKARYSIADAVSAEVNIRWEMQTSYGAGSYIFNYTLLLQNGAEYNFTPSPKMAVVLLRMFEDSPMTVNGMKDFENWLDEFDEVSSETRDELEKALNK